MEFITALMAGGATSALSGAAYLKAIGEERRDQIKYDIKRTIANQARNIVTATDPDGSNPSVRNIERDVVDFKQQLEDIERMKRKLNANPNRPTGPYRGISDYGRDDRPENPDYGTPEH